jgi:hypothetical protein
MMNGRGKSDSAIVAGKPTNKAGQSAAESVEPSAEAEGNASQQSTRRTQSRVFALARIARRPLGLDNGEDGPIGVVEAEISVAVPRGRIVALYRHLKLYL